MGEFDRVDGVDYVIDRWAAGIPHHPKSESLVRRLVEIDFHCFGDNFCWKVGGDGGRGEMLMYELDVYFDEQDKLNPDIPAILASIDERLERLEDNTPQRHLVKPPPGFQS